MELSSVSRLNEDRCQSALERPLKGLKSQLLQIDRLAEAHDQMCRWGRQSDSRAGRRHRHLWREGVGLNPKIQHIVSGVRTKLPAVRHNGIEHSLAVRQLSLRGRTSVEGTRHGQAI